ncbi:hypothetical protein [Thorsellia anophelis]|uniref:Uncharacterized protein n=1 Tax=Thorsellia anophelis DSM 18579 TaxID=1123402 RepID=A0A1I0DKA3_9GAMM|nr:hypothetical protein [Thorsellia anophelis]SET32778.1 hypothetical protein SAMN02583745_02023 [Thorsellia anophelis DSM 18579]
MKSKLLCTLVLLLPILSVHAEPTCPLMEGTQIIIGASQEVFSSKNSGVKKEELLKQLSNNPQAEKYIPLLTEIVNEIYQLDALNPKIYAAYRTELCFAEQKYETEVKQIDFSKASPLLKACESDSNPTVCAMKVVHKISSIPESL